MSGVRMDLISVSFAALSIFTMGGIIFGIGSIYPVLYFERALEGPSCGVVFVDNDGRGWTHPEECEDSRRRVACCPAQKLKFTAITSIALFAADGGMLMYGELGDRLGPRACFGTGMVLFWVGLSFLAMASLHVDTESYWYLAFFFIGVSGPGIFMGSMFLGEKYPRVRPIISAVAASMWDGSALVFKFFEMWYDHLVPQYPVGGRRVADPPPALTLIAVAWMVITACLGGMTWCLLPSRQLLEHLRTADGSSAEPLRDDVDDPTDGEGATPSTPDAATSTRQAPSSGSPAAPQTGSFLSFFCRMDTKLMLCFMAVYNLKSSFYIATFSSEMNAMFFRPTADSLTNTFNIAFPVGGFVTSVIGATLLDKLGEREDLYMTLVLLLAIMFGLYNLLPYAASQFASALLFGPVRTLQWACYFHFLSHPKRYPSHYVGRLLGYGNLVIAVVGDVPLAAMQSFILYNDYLGSRAARYLLVHFVLQLLLIGTLALPWYLSRQRVAVLAKEAAAMAEQQAEEPEEVELSVPRRIAAAAEQPA
jgi:MFS family permease